MSENRRVVLASASARRKALLEAAAYDVVVCAADVDESWPEGALESAIVEIARRKLASAAPFTEVTLAADTVVVLGEERLGKPRDAGDAQRMLQALAGREHRVVTGFVARKLDREVSGVVTTRVRFRALSEVEIERYVATPEPFDKAGAYAIQGAAGAFVDTVQGSYTNVVGLPVAEALRAIESLR